MRENELDKAEASFHLAYEIAHLPQAVDGLGCVAFRQGDRETAARLFQQAFDLDSSYSQALANLALVFEAQGREDAARVLYQRILAFDPQNAAARNNYSALLFDRQAQEQARDELLKAQALTQSALIEQNLKKVDSHRRIQ
ncbi:MAG: tetratricopeptide repeat protein [Deltaproteobacteria bacterium]|nr:tetratricopeptide repeat protein [Deltaproteobacteria bacterium]